MTLFGESAGAGNIPKGEQLPTKAYTWIACVLYQLSSPESIFQRAISMSGTPLMFQPVSPAVAETTYKTITEQLGLKQLSADERIARLLILTPDEIVAKTPMTFAFRPVLDGDIVPTQTTFKSIGPEEFSDTLGCVDLMIGDCQHDV